MTARTEQTMMGELVGWLRETLTGDAEAAGVFRRVSLMTEADANADTEQARDRYLSMVTPEQVLADVSAKLALLDLYEALTPLAPAAGEVSAQGPVGQIGGPLAALDTTDKMVRALASGYQDRPGWNPEWR